MADESCTISVVSSSVNQARVLVERLKALAESYAHTGPSAPQTQEQEADTIPWTIQNKYYSADVQFRISELDRWVATGAPALVYVWSPGESFRDGLQKISQEITNAGHEPEVQLAIRVSASSTPSEDEDGLDPFFSEHGFEFISASESAPLDDDEDHGRPGLARMVDAISTIMWPSMVQAPAALARKSRGAHDLLSFSQLHNDLSALKLADPDSHRAHEMAELERWLTDGSDLTPSASQTSKVASSEPRSMFDDDFGAFMSSEPSQIPSSSTVTGLPHLVVSGSGDLDVDAAFPSHPARMRALGSQMSFDSSYDFDAASHSFAPSEDDEEDLDTDVDESFAYAELQDDSLDEGHGLGFVPAQPIPRAARASTRPGTDDEHDEELPTEAEIAATSRRIFGSGTPPPPNPFAAQNAPPQPPSIATAESPAKMTTFSTSIIPTWVPPSSDPSPRADAGEGFDLNRVFGALQGMKEEIGMMEDESERRRAAARVALGLVYGLDNEAKGEGEDGGHDEP